MKWQQIIMVINVQKSVENMQKSVENMQKSVENMQYTVRTRKLWKRKFTLNSPMYMRHSKCAV